MGWFIRDVDRAATECFITFGGITGAAYYALGVDSTDTLFVWNDGAAPTGSTVTAGTWNHMALVVEGTGAGQVKVYLNGVLDITGDGNAALTAARLVLCNNHNLEFINGRAAAVKVWDAALTADEIKQEVRCIRPVRLASLNSGFPMFPGSGERVRDYSGLGRDLVEAGTLVDEDPPDVSWGASPMLVPFAAAGGAVTVQPFMFVIT